MSIPILMRPKSVINRGNKRTIEDLGHHVTDPAIHDICERNVNSWSDEEAVQVQAEINRLSAS